MTTRLLLGTAAPDLRIVYGFGRTPASNITADRSLGLAVSSP